MPFLAGFVYYFAIFVVYAAASVGAIKLGAALRKRKSA